MMPSDAFTTLRAVNDKLRSALQRLQPEQRRCSAIAPAEFPGLLAELLRGRECLRNLPAQTPTGSFAGCEHMGALNGVDALEKEAREYRSNLEGLKRFLPDLHARLLAEKARLENAQTHLAAASAWARASKRTL